MGDGTLSMQQENILIVDKEMVKQQVEVIGKNICIQNTNEVYFFPELWSEDELEHWGEE